MAAFCWALAAYSALHMRPDTGSLPFFPDSDTQARRMAEALDIAPASRLLFVDISTDLPEGRHVLAAVADAVLRDMPDDLARPAVTAVPEPQAVMALLPYYTDGPTLERLRRAAEAPRVEQAVIAARDRLGNLLTVGPARDWLRADPLGLRGSILDRLPSQGRAGLLPDPATGYPCSADGAHLLLTLRPLHSLHDVDHAERLMETLHAALQRHLAPDMRAVVVGGLRHSAANARVIRQDVADIALISLLGFTLVYVLLVRSAGAVWLLLVPWYAAGFALGVMSAAHPALSGLALGFGASVLGVAEDYAVHMHFALRSGGPPERVLPVVAPPLLQGFLINASGFAVLLLSGIPAVRQLACFALLTLGAGFVLAVTLLPACPRFATPPLRQSRESAPPRRPVLRRTAACVCLLLTVCGVLLQKVQVDVSPRTLGADVAQLQEDARQLGKIWGARDEHILVAEGATTAEALDAARQAVAAMRELEPDNRVDTLTALWPSPAEIRENTARWQQFACEHGEALRQALTAAGERHGFSPTAFEPFLRLLRAPVADFGPERLRAAGLGELLDIFVHEDGGGGGARVLLRTERRADSALFAPQLAAHVLAMAPGDLETTLLRQFAAEKRLVPVAWLVCAALLFCWFRNLRQTLLASLPPLCSIGCILAWMVASGHELTLAGMAAMPLVLGLSADHGILVAHDLACGVKTGVQRAVLVSSLTTLTGMGLLALAQHPALRAMGEGIFWGLLMEAPAALWLLPRLCAPVEEAQA